MVSIDFKFIGLGIAGTRHAALKIRDFSKSLAPSHYYKEATKAIKVATLALKAVTSGNKSLKVVLKARV